MRRLQTVSRWIDLGIRSETGRVVILAMGLLLIIGFLGHRRFQGLPDESAYRDALLSRGIASGEGWATPLRYPQHVAILRAGGWEGALPDWLPDYGREPLYPLLLSPVWSVVPDQSFQSVPRGGRPFVPDLAILGWHGLLWWLALLLLFIVVLRGFGELEAWLALGVVLVSPGLWQAVLRMDGTPLLMLLVGLWLYAGACWLREPRWLTSFTGGALTAALLLTEYTTLGLVLGGLSVLACHARGLAWVKLLTGGILALALCLPWAAHNLSGTGNVLGLAAQEAAWWQYDPAMQPERALSQFTAERTELVPRKLLHETSTHLQQFFADDLWTQGVPWLSLFALAGLLYPYRNLHLQQARWLCLAAVGGWVLVEPLFSHGSGERAAAPVVGLVLTVWGASFFCILLDGVRRPSAGVRWLWAAGWVVLASLPFWQMIMEPRRAPYQFPPYLPVVLERMDELNAASRPDQRPVSDIPAGLSWYANALPVWQQPAEYSEMGYLLLEEPLFALLLSPKTLNAPYFTQLSTSGMQQESGLSMQTLTWGEVYQGLAADRLPSGFLFPEYRFFYPNMVLFWQDGRAQ